MGYPQGSVFYLTGLFTEDSAEQFFFCRELSLTLGADLSNQDVTRVDLSADADDAVFIQFAETLFSYIGDITGNLFRAKLGITSFNLMFLNMDRGEFIIFHQAAADDDSILIVITFPTGKAQITL